MTGKYHVSSLFAENSTVAGFFSVEGFSQCLYGVMYIDLTPSSGKSQLAMLITAKASGWAFTRIDYIQGAYGKCSVSGVHVAS